MKQRVAEQLKTAAIKNYKIELDESAERDDGTIFTDHEVRAALVRKKFENTELEWMRCSIQDLKTVLTELRTGQRFTGTHSERFPMRREQTEAVKVTHAYFHSRWEEDMHAVPRFLWNAKMRFGKTFTTYQLARKLGAKRVLVVTFKPAVEDAWQTDLESHVDFDGWQYLSRNSDLDPTEINPRKPVVYFGSFQDLLGRDKTGNIKPKNEWLHAVNWDLVVFDEYHFGAWRDTAKELFEGEEEAVAKKSKLEYAAALEDVNEDLSVLSEKETEFLPDHDQSLPLPFRNTIQSAGHGRVHRRTNLQLDLHRRTARQGRLSPPRTQASGTLTVHCRRCVCLPTRCRTNC